MHKILLFVLSLFFCGVVSGQDLSELEKRYGFKDIRLETVPDSVKGVKLVKEFKEKEEFPAKLYSVSHEDYSRIGEVKVREVELKAYKDQIYEISVIADKDVRLMKALESLYGKADYDLKNETYFWKTNNLILKFRSAGRNQLELLYTSYVVQKIMKEDKKKKVDDIANDF
jgi:hypothetical protein